MSRIDLLSQPLPGASSTRRARAFFASCAFHLVALGLLLGLAFYYRSHLPPPNNGSAPGAPVITLSTLVVSAPPEPPPPPALAKPAPPAPVASVTAAPAPHEAEIKPPPPEANVPVLAVQSPEPEPAQPPKVVTEKSSALAHPAISHAPTVTTAAPVHAKPAPAATSVSSYSPGPSLLPHPPYPSEARNLHQTGTVIMNIRFDAGGGVALAEVAHSSGVAVLDSSTRSFIRTHWHSPAYAGQTVSVPVQYTLENL